MYDDCLKHFIVVVHDGAFKHLFIALHLWTTYPGLVNQHKFYENAPQLKKRKRKWDVANRPNGLNYNCHKMKLFYRKDVIWCIFIVVIFTLTLIHHFSCQNIRTKKWVKTKHFFIFSQWNRLLIRWCLSSPSIAVNFKIWNFPSGKK